MVKTLLLGATGYIGGEVLYQLAQKHDNGLALTCLVRDERKTPAVKTIFPNARIVIGGLDDIAILKREVENTDLVIHLAATVHAVSVLAIAEALQARKKRVGSHAHWIQMSGGSVFIADEVNNQRFGCASDEVHDDLKDRVETISIINKNPMKISEQIVLRQSRSVVRTALLMGPHIYGRGRGPWNQRTVQCTEIARATLKSGHGLKLNEGMNTWSDVHVADFANLVCLLVQAAIKGQEDELWNEHGIYHPENGRMVFGELCRLIAKEAKSQGLINGTEEDIKTITPAEANELSNHADILWGTNAIITSTRAREKLGWTPTGHSLKDEIPMMVRQEARFLGLVKPSSKP